jgi:hypothetical protein
LSDDNLLLEVGDLGGGLLGNNNLRDIIILLSSKCSELVLHLE